MLLQRDIAVQCDEFDLEAVGWYWIEVGHVPSSKYNQLTRFNSTCMMLFLLQLNALQTKSDVVLH